VSKYFTDHVWTFVFFYVVLIKAYTCTAFISVGLRKQVNFCPTTTLCFADGKLA